MQTIRQQAKPRKQNPVLVQSVVSLHKFCFWIVAVGGCSLSSTNIVYPQISNLVWQLVPINFNSEFSPIPCSTEPCGSSLAAGSSWKQKLSWGRVIWQHIGNSHGRQARLLATSCRMAIGLGSPETIGQKNSATCFPASCTLSCSCSFCIILVYVRRNTRIQKDLHWRSDVSKVCYFCYWQCQETSWGWVRTSPLGLSRLFYRWPWNVKMFWRYKKLLATRFLSSVGQSIFQNSRYTFHASSPLAICECYGTYFFISFQIHRIKPFSSPFWDLDSPVLMVRGHLKMLLERSAN